MEVYLALGSNLGDKRLNLQKAIDEIGKRIGRVVRQSAFVESEPWGFVSDNSFVNAVISVETEMQPLDILRETQAIEKDLGRLTKSVNGIHSDRTIDIDILLCGNLVVNIPELTIPHPRMLERSFVMEPLREIWDKNKQSCYDDSFFNDIHL